MQKWRKKMLRRRGKPAGPTTEEVGKKLSPLFTARRDTRPGKLGGKCKFKSEIIDKLMAKK